MERKGGRSNMNETTVISRKFISKEMFIKEIKLDNYHFEIAGNNDELWLINEKTSKAVIKISLVFFINNEYVYTDDPMTILEGIELPFEGIIYFIEYSYSKLMNKISQIMNSPERNLYSLNENNTQFVKIKSLF